MDGALGIDIGGSTTKVVVLGGDVDAGMSGDAAAAPEVLACRQAPRAQGVPAVEQAAGLAREALARAGVAPARVAVTGVGAPDVPDELFGVSVGRIGEFAAVAAGGVALAYPAGPVPKDALVVSAGTGVALVRVRDGRAEHLGGSGVGGKFLTGLGELLLGTDDASVIAGLAARGDRGKVDLQVGDLCPEGIPGLPASLTAANFGAARLGAEREDVAAALTNAVFETIGMMAVFACKAAGIRDVVLTGTLATLPGMCEVAEVLGAFHGLRFVIPDHAAFATATGAALWRV